MEFKHKKDYETLSVACPPTDYIAKEIDPVYIFVFDEITDERNFISQYHKNPKRFLNKDDKIKCEALALSMFNDEQGCVARFKELKEIIGDSIIQTFGSKIAKGKIFMTDGVNGKIEKYGHFNHHPSINAKYNECFVITDL